MSYYLNDKKLSLFISDTNLDMLNIILTKAYLNKQNRIIESMFILLGNFARISNQAFSNIFFNKIMNTVIQILDYFLYNRENNVTIAIEVIELIAWFLTVMAKKYQSFDFKEEEYVIIFVYIAKG